MKNNNKIAIVSASLGIGGAERFSSLLSFMLHDLGYEVHHILILDKIDYDFKGTIVNLGKMFAAEINIFRALKKGKYIEKYLYENDIQFVIDNRSRPSILRELFAINIYGNRKVVALIHSSNLEMYLTNSIFWSNFIFNKVSKLVCVSHEIERKIKSKYNLLNTTTINNPICILDSITQKPANLPEEYMLFFGRLEEDVKNFSLLLNAFSKSKVYDDGIKLLLIGEGSSKDLILTTIEALQLVDHVELLPFQKDITPYIQHAKCTLLTSYFEGFPMALIESLAAGTPVISVDCEFGPKEIIQNECNGLLVKNHDDLLLAEAMQIFVKDDVLYQNCKKNAQKSVEHLSLSIISKQWQQLIETL
jgi:glycosyltransferase involved in cell wall biosynthesis